MIPVDETPVDAPIAEIVAWIPEVTDDHWILVEQNCSHALWGNS